MKRPFLIVAMLFLILTISPKKISSEERQTDFLKSEIQTDPQTIYEHYFGNPSFETKQAVTPEEMEKTEQLKKNAQKFVKTLSSGPVGRFQGISFSGGPLYILDTKEGHVWVFLRPNTLLYGGFVYPGVEAGDIVNTIKISR